MNTARIAELLEPFLRSPIAVPDPDLIRRNHSKLRYPSSAAVDSSGPNDSGNPNSCHSEPAKAREEPAVLSRAQLQHISTYIDILFRWNARINLTAIRDPEEIVSRHFGESLFTARHLFPAISPMALPFSAVKPFGGAGTLADLGSGAGFPGLPIKLWASHIAVTLVESNHKKATFLREVIRALTLTNVDIQETRAQTLAAHVFDVVTLRAVERFESILPVAAALVASTGRLAVLIGASQQEQARVGLPNFTWFPPVPIPGSRARILLIAQRG